MKTPQRAVFLDRDGVLNRTYLHQDGKTHPPASPEEMEILPGVAAACWALRRAGYLLIVVTNQPDVARGTQRMEVVEAINDKLLHQLALDDILVCYHRKKDNCFCRKPKPGLILAASNQWGIDLLQSFMVGDRWSDIEAGRSVRCKTILISESSGQIMQSKSDFQAPTLLEAADWILNIQQPIRRGKQPFCMCGGSRVLKGDRK